jgi:hypothetical protein
MKQVVPWISFVVVHFVKEHAQEKCTHQQHEYEHGQTHETVVGRKQIDQHFHGELQLKR